MKKDDDDDSDSEEQDAKVEEIFGRNCLRCERIDYSCYCAAKCAALLVFAARRRIFIIFLKKYKTR